MKTATISSVCECQARLAARLDERRVVLEGWASPARTTARQAAPAHAIDAGSAMFRVGWACPYCGRNTLRSFDAAALEYASSV